MFSSPIRRRFEMYQATVSRALRSPLLLRNIIYGSVIFLALYGLFYMTSSHNLSILPDYLKASGAQEVLHDDLHFPTGWSDRAEVVKKAFVHAYHGYERYAAPSDELRPLTQGRINKCVFVWLRCDFVPRPDAAVSLALTAGASQPSTRSTLCYS